MIGGGLLLPANEICEGDVCSQGGSASKGVGQSPHPPIGYYGIRSMSGWYISYWKAFLFENEITSQTVTYVTARDWDWDQYYAKHLTLQLMWELKQDQDHIEITVQHHKFACKFTSYGAEWLGKPFAKFLIPFKFPYKLQCEVFNIIYSKPFFPVLALFKLCLNEP